MKTQNDKVSEEVRELVYSDYNNKYEQLKSELKEKEKGCGERSEIKEYQGYNLKTMLCGEFLCNGYKTKICLCPTCQAKIEYLKKGISACEEILNSQQLKSGVSENSSLSEEAQTKGIVGEFNNNVKETSVETAGNPLGFSSQSADTQTLIKQALSQRNKEILEIIDKLENHFKGIELWENGLDKSEGYHKAEEYFEDLKQQLTTKEEGKA